MKKRITRLVCIAASVAMLASVSGCAEKKSEEVQKVEQYIDAI